MLGTAGHIDHGKSSLIQALTGTDPDRLAEEKKRGITIQLGFARLELPDGRSMGVVDVPGHERFVRQMIAGATGIDVALLCIAADDGIMPQTVEHLAVLELLGVPSCVVALTKIDLVDDEWVEFMKDEVARALEATPYGGAPIVGVSSRDGRGLPELLDAVAAVAKLPVRSRETDAARMPIDRVFTVKGSAPWSRERCGAARCASTTSSRLCRTTRRRAFAPSRCTARASMRRAPATAWRST